MHLHTDAHTHAYACALDGIIYYKGWYENNVSSFFSENASAITMEFTWMFHTSFAIMRLFFHKASIIFNTLLPTLSKMLHTHVIKFSALTLEHITRGTMKL
jgi:hypothetical protein